MSATFDFNAEVQLPCVLVSSKLCFGLVSRKFLSRRRPNYADVISGMSTMAVGPSDVRVIFALIGQNVIRVFAPITWCERLRTTNDALRDL